MMSVAEYIEVAKVLAPSLITAAAVAVSASIVGVFVLLRREALVALAMPHVVAVGAALALRLGWPKLPPALAAVTIALFLLVWSKRHGANQWLLPSLYIAGLSFSFLIIANAGAHVEEMQAVFVGIDVAVSWVQAYLAIPVLLISATVCALLWRRWLLLSQAPATAEVAGLRPGRWEIAFLCLLAIVLLVGTNDLGAVMMIAMLFLPAATVLPWARRVPGAIAGSVLAALLFLLGGFVLSMEMNYPLSQSVGAIGFVLLTLSFLTRQIFRRA
jgi:ABC-type Mn2+/Zn2+ transport system permease subunit